MSGLNQFVYVPLSFINLFVSKTFGLILADCRIQTSLIFNEKKHGSPYEELL